MPSAIRLKRIVHGVIHKVLSLKNPDILSIILSISHNNTEVNSYDFEKKNHFHTCKQNLEPNNLIHH